MSAAGPFGSLAYPSDPAPLDTLTTTGAAEASNRSVNARTTRTGPKTFVSNVMRRSSAVVSGTCGLGPTMRCL
jgi:hypothetical protein